MKKSYLNLFLAFFTNIIGLYAQEQTNAFFVYRNDGDFNVFFMNNVDSIKYSKIDTDSINHEQYVMQEVWTTDSVFRIPLAVIDSVAFKQPSTIYKDGVKVLDKDLFSYIVSTDSLKIIFSPDLPNNLKPAKGEKIVFDGINDILPYGFSGIVKSVTTQNDNITVECDSIGLSDIYERYFYIRSFNTTNSTDKQDSSAKRISTNTYFNNTIDLPQWSDSFDATLLEVKPSDEFSADVSAHLGYSVTPSMYIDLAFIISKETGKYFCVSMKNSYNLEVDANINGKITLNKDFEFSKWAKPKIPLGNGFFLYFKPGFFIKAEGTASFGYTHKGCVDTYFFFKYDSKYKENQQEPKFKIKYASEGTESDSPFNGNIELSAGLFAEFGLTFIDDIFDKLALRAEGGVKFQYSVPLLDNNTEQERSTAEYESLSDREWEFYPYCATSLEIEFLSFSRNPGLTIEPFKKPYLSGSFVPLFSNLNFIPKNTRHNRMLSVNVGNNLMFPIKVGFLVFDENNGTSYSKWNDAEYRNQESFSEYTTDFKEAILNHEYTVYPTIEWFRKTLLAIPYKEISFAIRPVTQEAENIDATSAILSGKIEGNTYLLDENCKYGFIYDTSSNLTTNGKTVYCDLTDNQTFSTRIPSLDDGTLYFYCAFIYTGEEYYYGETMSFTTEKKTEEAVDLGLSVKWRGWNLGADTPEGYGRYYAWGETTDKQAYTWETYFDNPYGMDNEWVGCTLTSDISNTEYDAASVELGNSWRMPTKDEMQELVSNCTWEWAAVNGVNGFKVTGPNGNYIFLPAAGNADGSNITSQGAYGGYWTSTPNNDGSGGLAGNMYFYGSSDTNLYNIQWSNRYNGRSIRPVIPY